MTTDSNHIRPAQFEDAAPIFELVKQHPEELVPRSISDIAQNIDRFLVSEMDGKVVGTVSWHILPEIGLPKNPSVEIKSLAVKEHSRNLGIGQALVMHAIESIRHLQPSQIIALTFHPEFFRKMGFTETPKEKLMHKIYTGCINCTKSDSPFTCPETAMSLTLGQSKSNVS